MAAQSFPKMALNGLKGIEHSHRILRHIGYLTASQLLPVLERIALQRHRTVVNFSLHTQGWRQLANQYLGQEGFARPTFPNNDQRLPCLHFKADVLQNGLLLDLSCQFLYCYFFHICFQPFSSKHSAKRLKATTVRKIARPGASIIQVAV